MPSPLVIKEEYEVMRPSVTLGKVEHLYRGHGDGYTVVKISSPGHLGVDDECWIPGVAPALGPDQVERLQGDVQC